MPDEYSIDIDESIDIDIELTSEDLTVLSIVEEEESLWN